VGQCADLGAISAGRVATESSVLSAVMAQKAGLGAGVTTTDGRSTELLVALLRYLEEQEQSQPEPPPAHRRRTAGWLALAAVALIVPVVLVGVAIAPSVPASGSAAPTPAGATFARTASAHTAAKPSPAATPTPAPVQQMSPDALAMTRAELANLAARLPAHVSMTAPAGWRKANGATPTYSKPGVSCPQVYGWIGGRLGGQWTYAFGAMPQGSCTWVPLPYLPQLPTTDRFVVSIGFEQGAMPGLLRRPSFCAGNVAAPQLPVPAVAEGAVLTGCDDDVWPSFELRVPDAGGTGVWFLSSVSGKNQHAYAPSEGLLAALDGASHAYG